MDGRAGAGKSFVIDCVIEFCDTHNHIVLVCSSTGVKALERLRLDLPANLRWESGADLADLLSHLAPFIGNQGLLSQEDKLARHLKLARDMSKGGEVTCTPSGNQNAANVAGWNLNGAAEVIKDAFDAEAAKELRRLVRAVNVTVSVASGAATKEARGNAPGAPAVIKKVLETKKVNGTGSGAPAVVKKGLETKKRNGTGSGAPAVVKKRNATKKERGNGPGAPAVVKKGLETKKKNGTDHLSVAARKKIKFEAALTEHCMNNPAFIKYAADRNAKFARLHGQGFELIEEVRATVNSVTALELNPFGAHAQAAADTYNAENVAVAFALDDPLAEDPEARFRQVADEFKSSISETSVKATEKFLTFARGGLLYSKKLMMEGDGDQQFMRAGARGRRGGGGGWKDQCSGDRLKRGLLVFPATKQMRSIHTVKKTRTFQIFNLKMRGYRV